MRVEQSPWPLRLSDLDAIMQGGDELVLFSEGEELYEATAREAHLRYRDLVARALQAHVAGATALVELGAGYGSVIVDLARRPEFAGIPAFGLDLTTAGAELIARMGAAERESDS